MSKLQSILNRNAKSSIESLKKLNLSDINGRTLTFSRIGIRNTVKVDMETHQPAIDENGNQIPITIPVVVFEEIPDSYLSCSSTVIKRAMDEWFSAYEGDLDALNADIAAERPRATFKFDEHPKAGRQPTMFMYMVD